MSSGYKKMKINTSYFRKTGFNVYQPIAGKKCMGTVRPGKSSGFCMSNGRLIEKGKIILANESNVKMMLKIISDLFPIHFFNPQYPKAARMQVKRQIPIRPPGFTSFANLASNA